jgi:hypothetical protein
MLGPNSNNLEEMLQALGAKLADHGIPIEQVVQSGMCKDLSPTQVQVLTNAYLQQRDLLKGNMLQGMGNGVPISGAMPVQQGSEPLSVPSSQSLATLVSQGILGGDNGLAKGSPAAADARSVRSHSSSPGSHASGSLATMSNHSSILSSGQANGAQDGASAQNGGSAAPAGSATGSFDAFAYGFFTDAPSPALVEADALLEELEPDGVTVEPAGPPIDEGVDASELPPADQGSEAIAPAAEGAKESSPASKPASQAGSTAGDAAAAAMPAWLQEYMLQTTNSGASSQAEGTQPAGQVNADLLSSRFTHLNLGTGFF